MDIFNYLIASHASEKQGLNYCQLEGNQYVIVTKEKYAIMDIVDEGVDDAPKVGFSIKIKFKSLDEFRDVLGARIKHLTSQLLTVKKEIEKINIKLVQHIAGFQNLGFDESRIFIVSERKNSFTCFSNCNNNKSRKNCEVF